MEPNDTIVVEDSDLPVEEMPELTTETDTETESATSDSDAVE